MILLQVSDKAFANLPGLENLHLSGGGALKHIAPDAFAGLSELKVLDISGNSLTKPEAQWFEKSHAKGLQSFSSHKNSWVCDCSAVEYKQWMNNNSLNLTPATLSVQCYEPIYLKGEKGLGKTINLGKNIFIIGVSKTSFPKCIIIVNIHRL